MRSISARSGPEVLETITLVFVGSLSILALDAPSACWRRSRAPRSVAFVHLVLYGRYVVADVETLEIRPQEDGSR